MIRRAGLLVHPTSLPGPYGIGDVGPAVRELLAWMDAAELRIWQTLPITPLDPFGSPYASDSSFAWEPLLLSVDDLVEDEWLLARERPFAPSRANRIDWAWVRREKAKALALAAERVAAAENLDAFGEANPELREFALFRALQREQQGAWFDWPEPLRERDPSALEEARGRLGAAVSRHLALQWLLQVQWGRVREEARSRGIEIWGDVPFFVGHGSCDVWCAPELWRLDADRQPLAISGVPPDAFSTTGQLWGHPHYDEEAHREQGYAWWLSRFARCLEAFDRVRIDHFRGFAAVWELAAGAETAIDGTWVPGPGRPLLRAMKKRFPGMPFLAEDLGVITEEVANLREDYDLAGMTILQFAFGGDAAQPYLPHNHVRNRVVYTGTHDNDTTLGWYWGTSDHDRDHVRRYFACADRDLPHALTRAAWRSVADTAILPLQDVLGLGSDGRLNKPGTTEGNWAWRAGLGAFSLALARGVAEEVRISGRAVPKREPEPRASGPKSGP